MVSVLPSRAPVREVGQAIIGEGAKRVLPAYAISPSGRLSGQRGRVLQLVQRNFLDGRVTRRLKIDVCAIGGRQGGVLDGLSTGGVVRTVRVMRGLNVCLWSCKDRPELSTG